MAEALALFFIALVAIVAGACAVNFFWQTGLKKAVTYASIAVGAFLLFWITGLWQNSSRHSWGVLTPAFAAILISCWLCIKFLPRLINLVMNKINRDH